jgi:hypothetical protein
VASVGIGLVAMRRYGPGTPLVFSHVPKTAGTSLGAALDQVLKPAVAVHGGIDTALFGGYDDIGSISPALRAGIFLSPEELPVEASLVTAHVAPATTTARYPGADHITVLRTPQVRLLSQWLHCRSLSEFTLRRWGPSGDAFRAGRRPLRDYLDHAAVAPTVDNTITRFLAWPHPALSRTEFIDARDDDALVAAAIERLDGFAHVNLVENPAFLADLSSWLGVDLPRAQLNERTSVLPRWRPDLAVELDPRTREKLDHRCRLDVRVWAHVAKRVLSDVDPATVRDEALSAAVERYSEMLRHPYDASIPRRVVEAAYDVRSRLPRRPAGRSVVQNVHQLRRAVPAAVVPSVVRRRLDRLWENDVFRAEQESEMEFLLGCSERAAEVPQLAYAYAEQMMIRAYLRWHPRLVTSQRIKGLEWLTTRRDESRSMILSFMHHHRYEAMFASIVRAGGPRTTVVVTEAITKPEAGVAFAQHMRLARRGGPIVHAEVGTQGLAAELTPGTVLSLAVDFPGHTPVTFLGRRVLAPFGTPRLAQLTNSLIVLATNHRDDEGPYVQLHPPLEPRDYADPGDLLVDLLGRFEPSVLAWPEALESPRARFGQIVDD